MVEKDKKKFELSDSDLQLRVKIFLRQVKLYVIAPEAGSTPLTEHTYDTSMPSN